jgi:hypothetical protein
MNVMIKDTLTAAAGFLRNKTKRRLLFLVLLGIAAFTEFLLSGLVRRTFVFYSMSEGMMTVEDRMLKRSSSQELDIVRYVEEVLLGPIAPDSAPLFPGETKLVSLLYRGGVVYADLSETAALPPLEGGEVFRNFYTLNAGIRRNFAFVKDVRLFITGKAVYFDDFQRIFPVEEKK